MTKKPKPSAIAKRADLLLSDKMADGPDDGLLTTKEVADWFRCSTQWLEINRKKHIGPRWVKASQNMVRYRRKDCRDWLQKHLHSSTSEYVKPKAAKR